MITAKELIEAVVSGVEPADLTEAGASQHQFKFSGVLTVNVKKGKTLPAKIDVGLKNFLEDAIKQQIDHADQDDFFKKGQNPAITLSKISVSW